MRIGWRILLLMTALLVMYAFSFVLAILFFIVLRNALPPLQGLEMGTVRLFLLLGIGAIALLVFLWLVVKPVLHTMRWIQELSRGRYQEPQEKWAFALQERLLQIAYSLLYRELRTHMEDLSRKLQSDEDAQERLEKSRREWLAGITHDLKTPLSYIQGYADLMAAERYQWTRDEVGAFSTQMKEKSRHIQMLIDDLNVSFQSDSGRLVLQRVETEMVGFVRNMVLDAVNTPRGMQYEFSFETELEECVLSVDSSLIRRALQNIVMNAMIHNAAGTEIRVVLSKNKGWLHICIADNGKGMDEEALKQLFNRYYRATPTDHPAEGSGLGMAIAKQFIELHGGMVEASSREGQGSSFLVKLPA